MNRESRRYGTLTFRDAKKSFIKCVVLLSAVGMAAGVFSLSGAASNATSTQPNLGIRHKETIQQDGYVFKDLNGNGVLGVYEDWRRPVDERVSDLLAQMTLDEKVAQMMHPSFIPTRSGDAPPFMEDWTRVKAVGFVRVSDLPSGSAAAKCMNQLQEWCEQSRLGIPIVVSMDSVHGLSYVNGAIVYPHALGIAAMRDLDLVHRLGEAMREESVAVGVRMTLSPNTDVATEPRWGRVMECPSGDANLAADIVRTEVLAIQNGPSLNETSVMTCAKHFPGSGPQMDGVDTAPIVTRDGWAEYHLQPFTAAIEAGTGSIMPYYSIPLRLDTVAALGSRATIQGLLREQMGYDGIVTTDWGMVWGIQQSAGFYGKEISKDDAFVMGIADAGIDAIGGASVSFIADVVRLVGEGRIPVDTIDESVTRILTAKFELGIFGNPYVDPDRAEKVVGCPEHQALSLEAAEKAMTLLKNDGTLPLHKNSRILVAGARANDMDSLTGGWTGKQDGVTIRQAITTAVGNAGKVVYEETDPERAKELAAECDVAVVVVGESSYMHNPPWSPDRLDLADVQQKLLEAIHETGTPIVVVVLMARPYILTWCAENTDAILVAYLPGTQGGVAIANTLFVDSSPQGCLPIELPRSMASVRKQASDVPFDIEDPLYDFGFGLRY